MGTARMAKRRVLRGRRVMFFRMTVRENRMLLEALRPYRRRTALKQRAERHAIGIYHRDLFWAERNRDARALYRRLLAT